MKIKKVLNNVNKKYEMDFTIMKIIKLLLILETIILVSGIKTFPAVAQNIALSSLCNKFPLNSRCQDHDFAANKSNQKINQHVMERDTFCAKAPLNSYCQQKQVEVFQLNLDRSGEDDEWVRIEKKGNKVNLLHTTKVEDFWSSLIINGALSFIPYPIPFDTNTYNWDDHQVIQVSFKSDRCKTDSCIITSKKTLNLPQGTNVYQGLFTIEYQEEELRRSLSFKIPADIKPTIGNTVIINVPDETLKSVNRE
ncbi:MAG: hypothetical protein RLZZ535_1443 [Cyanobacteriota bacterium]